MFRVCISSLGPYVILRFAGWSSWRHGSVTIHPTNQNLPTLRHSFLTVTTRTGTLACLSLSLAVYPLFLSQVFPFDDDVLLAGAAMHHSQHCASSHCLRPGTSGTDELNRNQQWCCTSCYSRCLQLYDAQPANHTKSTSSSTIHFAASARCRPRQRSFDPACWGKFLGLLTGDVNP